MSGVKVTQADRDFHAQINRLVEPKCGFVPLKETAELVARHREASVAEVTAQRDALLDVIEAAREASDEWQAFRKGTDPVAFYRTMDALTAALQEHGRG